MYNIEERSQYYSVESLPSDNIWFKIRDAVSVPTFNGGNWQSIPHLACGKRHWSMMMQGPSKMTAEILKANGLSHYECRHCPSGRGYWEDHVPGPKHYNQISSLLGNRRIAEAKEELWQEWVVPSGGVVKFSHLDGEIFIMRINTTSVPPLLSNSSVPPPPLTPPPRGTAASSLPRSSQVPVSIWQSSAHGSSLDAGICQSTVLHMTNAMTLSQPRQVATSALASEYGPLSDAGTCGSSITVLHSTNAMTLSQPRHLASSGLASEYGQLSDAGTCGSQISQGNLETIQSQGAPSGYALLSPEPEQEYYFCPFAIFMWQRLVPDAVTKLRFNMKIAAVPQGAFTCKLCGTSGHDLPIQLDYIDAHLRSSSHIYQLEQTIKHLSQEELQKVQGKEGPQIQSYEGEIGKVWFNHITAESGTHDVIEAYKWEKYEYEEDTYWYNQETSVYFQVCNNYGIERGIW